MKNPFSSNRESRRESRRSSVSKSKPAPALQFFTYEDVVEANKPRIGEYPQHGDTVVLSQESEAEAAAASEKRASKRHSQAYESATAGHEDIFANAPEEPLAPQGPSRRSRENSMRSSRRMSRRQSVDGAAGSSSSRNSRAISPDRQYTNGVPLRSGRESATGERYTAPPSEGPTPRLIQATTQTVTSVSPQPVEPRSQRESMQRQPLSQTLDPALGAAARTSVLRAVNPDEPPLDDASPVQEDALSKMPTASDALSRVQTRASSRPVSGTPSRQATVSSALVDRTKSSATSTKTSRRQSKRATKPQELKYFTYNDVVAGEPPKFGDGTSGPEVDSSARASRSIKGKEREAVADETETTNGVEPQAGAPQVPELPMKLSTMDMAGTGLSRRTTVQEAPQTTTSQRHSRGLGAQGPQTQTTEKSGASRGHPALAASHGLDLSDIPGNAPPVNLSNKPASKQVSRHGSRDFRSGPAPSAGAIAAAASAAAGAAAAAPRHSDAMSQPTQKARATVHNSPPTEQLAPTIAQETQKETFLPGAAPSTFTKTTAPSSALPIEARSVPVPGPSAPTQLPVEAPTEAPAQELDSHPVVQRTREALPNAQFGTPKGARTPKARRAAPPPPSQDQTGTSDRALEQAPAAPQVSLPSQAQPATTSHGQMNTEPSAAEVGAFVSAPSTPTRDTTEPRRGTSRDGPASQSNSVPSAEDVIARAKYNSANTTVTETVAPAVVHETVHKNIQHVREERITREVHTYDIYHRIQPIIDVEVLSTRHFMSKNGGGFIEVSEKDIPRHDLTKPAWTIQPTPNDSAARQSLVEQRHSTPTASQGVREEKKEWMHPDGYPVTETLHIHPPTVYTGAAGQTVPFHFDHATGQAGYLPPGVPQPSVTRTRGNSVTKSSVEETADNLGKVQLEDSTVEDGLKPAAREPAQRVSTEHLSSQHI